MVRKGVLLGIVVIVVLSLSFFYSDEIDFGPRYTDSERIGGFGKSSVRDSGDIGIDYSCRSCLYDSQCGSGERCLDNCCEEITREENECVRCPDLNLDGIVDNWDGVLFYECAQQGNCPDNYDLNGDGLVSILSDVHCLEESQGEFTCETGLCSDFCSNDEGCEYLGQISCLDEYTSSYCYELEGDFYPEGILRLRENPCDQGEICSNGICIDPNIDAECFELIPGHNNINEERINMMFVGRGFEDNDVFQISIIDELINEVGDSPSNSALFSDSVTGDYKDKFNLWYTSYQQGGPSYSYAHLAACLDEYEYIPNPLYNQRIFVYNEPGRSFAGRGGMVLFFDSYHAGETFLHEFGHSFGLLADEYLELNYASPIQYDDVPREINVDVATELYACEKWCSGQPLPIEDLPVVNCEQYGAQDCRFINGCYFIGAAYSGCFNENDPNDDSCDDNYNNKESCELDPICYWVEEGSCQNYLQKLEHCDTLNLNEQVCYGDGSTECFWSSNKDRYLDRHCIPEENNIDIGTNCMGDSGCWMGGYYTPNYMRPSFQSKMRHSLFPWEYVNEQHMRNLLDQVGTQAIHGEGLQQHVSDNVIWYDEFDAETGEIISGGVIDLGTVTEAEIDALDEDLKKAVRELVPERKTKRSEIIDPKP